MKVAVIICRMELLSVHIEPGGGVGVGVVKRNCCYNHFVLVFLVPFSVRW